MSDVIIVALLSLAGTIISGLISSALARSVMIYRLEQLEMKVDKHNNLIERMYHAEEDISLIKSEIKFGTQRIENLEDK